MSTESDAFAQTTDALMFAEEFTSRVKAGLDATDVGTMTSWFAVAIENGRNAGTSE